MLGGTALLVLTVLALPAQETSTPFPPSGQTRLSEEPATESTAPPLPSDGAAQDAGSPHDVLHHVVRWPEIWGTVGLSGDFGGNRMAPNGVPFAPLFSADSELNLGILPHKEFYVFVSTDFWAQRANDQVTNPHQGSWDFSKREFDVGAGLAWNYFRSLELRGFLYSLNNLNRGNSLSVPFGFKDGVGVENRYYFPSADIYDVGRLSFLSIGYMPSKTLAGADGLEFGPGLFLRAYLTQDLPWIRSYLFFDGEMIAESAIDPRLFSVDAGLAIRPFLALPNLEFRLGGTDLYDRKVDHNRGFGYGAVRLFF
jgi:hypothetical protein